MTNGYLVLMMTYLLCFQIPYSCVLIHNKSEKLCPYLPPRKELLTKVRQAQEIIKTLINSRQARMLSKPRISTINLNKIMGVPKLSGLRDMKKTS